VGVEPKQVSTYVGVIEGLQATMEIVMIHVVRTYSGYGPTDLIM
jgi:hypothetical protein